MQRARDLIGLGVELRIGVAQITFHQKDARAELLRAFLQPVRSGERRGRHVFGGDRSATVEDLLRLLARDDSRCTHHFVSSLLVCFLSRSLSARA
ncbi:hypothetical protein SDC9_168990 [bioreactor metagenome]|uniref:Uncharacterized protein n=1 Tax=bioreactor metagenome TaxID=1076179 RepID=A0A645G6L3_9ZZZZ